MGFQLLSSLVAISLTAPVPADETAITVNEPSDLSPVPTVDLVTMYNRMVPSAPVKKFKDRETANTRLFKLLQSEADAPPAEEVQDTNDPGWNTGAETDTAPDAADNTTSSKEENVATATAGRRGAKSTRKSGAKGSTATKSAAKRGRAPGFAGAKLFRVGDENPCRTGGLRAQSWDLVKPQGISYEKYLSNGGRAQELAFNVRQGRVRVEYPKGNGKAEE